MTGSQKSAWELCKENFGGDTTQLTPPPYMEFSDQQILFAWNEEEAAQSGGPSLCRTTGDGNEIIEVRIHSAPFG
ncbi:MAG: hypothetical protein ABJP34_07305 [Erythrobacter sp.]